MTRREVRYSRCEGRVHCILTIREPYRLPTVILSPGFQYESDALTYCEDRERNLQALRDRRTADEMRHVQELDSSGARA